MFDGQRLIAEHLRRRAGTYWAKLASETRASATHDGSRGCSTLLVRNPGRRCTPRDCSQDPYRRGLRASEAVLALGLPCRFDEDSKPGGDDADRPPGEQSTRRLPRAARGRLARPWIHAYLAKSGTRRARTLLKIVPYSPAQQQAVERLNAKLANAGSGWSFPPRERPTDVERIPAWDESFVATEDEEVYGGYILKHRRFLLEGHPVDFGALQLPLSLGEVDSAFAHVSVALLFDAIRRTPYLYSLGLGSEKTQYARLLSAAGWQHVTVPFFFDVKSANRFAREIRLPRDKASMETALRILGRTRLAGAALGLRRRVVSRSSRASGASPPLHARELATFDGVADALFSKSADAYILVADRGEQALRYIYPPEESGFLRLAVQREDEVVGWAVVLDAEMRDNKYFGNMRVGSIADCFAAPDDAPLVVAAADAYLAHRGVDIVVSNQLHPVWCDSLKMTGYEQGPSNFFFYFSPELAERLDAIPAWQDVVHINRGDGEGPGHLMGDEDFAT